MDFAKVLSIALISLLGAMSPGPDFAIVTKNSLAGSFRCGLLTALGVGSAIMVHVTYCVFGVAILIYESPSLFLCLKYLGASYLFYLGVMLLKEEMKQDKMQKKENLHLKKHHPFVSGFLCNLLNPKATFFVLSLFTQFIDPEMFFWEKMVLGSVIAVVGIVWFVLLSYLITHRLLQRHFARFQVFIAKAMGVALCLLAIYVAFLS